MCHSIDNEYFDALKMCVRVCMCENNTLLFIFFRTDETATVFVIDDASFAPAKRQLANVNYPGN